MHLKFVLSLCLLAYSASATVSTDLQQILAHQHHAMNLLVSRYSSQPLAAGNSEVDYIGCFADYSNEQNDVVAVYEKTYTLCRTTASDARSKLTAESAEKRKDLLKRGNNVCTTLSACEQYEDGLDFFQCYNAASTKTYPEVYTLSTDSETEANLLQIQYYTIKNDEDTCTTTAKNIYIASLAKCNSNFNDCLNGISTPATVTPVQPSTVEPTVTDSPVEPTTEEPIVTDSPVESTTEEPIVTVAPVDPTTEEAIVTDAPVDSTTDEAIVTDAPVETTTEEPIATDAPVETTTEEPIVTDAPVETTTEEPIATDAPVEPTTEEPIVTDAPVETTTEEPIITDAPVETTTEEPIATDAPVEPTTEEPIVTDAPVETTTEEPIATDAPVEPTTEEPIVTDAPIEATTEEHIEPNYEIFPEEDLRMIKIKSRMQLWNKFRHF